jgi:molybdopterin-containing oxidoreductase family iron-sulfur binding subunit
VPIDYAQCIGCGACVGACPYEARTLDDGASHSDGTPAAQPYETKPAFEYGVALARVGKGLPVGKARKCHFCLHRLGAGQLPACITTCIGRAGYFGDESDPGSLVAQVKQANEVQLLEPGAGTAPRVYYVSDVKLEVFHG